MTQNKVTREDVLANMQDVIVRTVLEFNKPATYVAVRMLNGFTVRESTTCVDPDNYNEEIGKQICLKKIEDKIWFLLGYALQEKISGQIEQTIKSPQKQEDKKHYSIISHEVLVASETSCDGIGFAYNGDMYEANSNKQYDVTELSPKNKPIELKVDTKHFTSKEEVKDGMTYFCIPLMFGCIPCTEHVLIKVMKYGNQRIIMKYSFKEDELSFTPFSQLTDDSYWIYPVTR